MSVPLPDTCKELLERRPVEVSITIGHNDEVCPVVDGTYDAHSNCWRVTIDDDSQDEDLVKQFEKALADFEIVNLLKAREVFYEGIRYSFDIKFEKDYNSREGIVFRESRLIARELGLKSITPGAFLGLDSEQLQIVLIADKGGIQIGTYSSLTGERLSSGALISTGKKWKVEDTIAGFINETEDFVESYFGPEENVRDRVIDFDELLEDMRLNLI